MKVIHKIKQRPLTEAVELKEADVNPLEVSVQDSTADEQYKQAILKAIASETSAEVEYEQILQLEDKVSKELVDLFHDTLVDIKNEEIKHLAQLTQKSSERLDIAEYFQKGEEEAETGKDTEKEEVKESVELKEMVKAGRTYSGLHVAQIIAKVLNMTDDQYWDDLLQLINEDEEYEAEQVDNILTQLQKYYVISPEKLDTIENQIIATSDPKADRQEEFKSDIHSDISSIEDLIEDATCIATKEKLREVINYLKELQYNGEKGIGWSKYDLRKIEDYNHIVA